MMNLCLAFAGWHRNTDYLWKKLTENIQAKRCSYRCADGGSDHLLHCYELNVLLYWMGGQ